MTHYGLFYVFGFFLDGKLERNFRLEFLMLQPSFFIDNTAQLAVPSMLCVFFVAPGRPFFVVLCSITSVIIIIVVWW